MPERIAEAVEILDRAIIEAELLSAWIEDFDNDSDAERIGVAAMAAVTELVRRACYGPGHR